MTGGPPLIDRFVSRVIVLDPADRVLLFFARIGHSVDPERRPDAIGFWALPGGGVEPGETHEAAAVRELSEETGLVAAAPMQLVATRTALYPWKGRCYRSNEKFYFARCDGDRLDTSGWQDGDKRWMSELGWWTLDRLVATNDIVRPPGLVSLVAEAIAGRLPSTPTTLPG